MVGVDRFFNRIKALLPEETMVYQVWYKLAANGLGKD
jgi:hypothetical protein